VGQAAVSAAAAEEPGAIEDLRGLLVRQALAVERHRAAIGRRPHLGDTEMGALVHLSQEGELTPGELRARLSLSSGGTTALIQRLERAGHVERRRHPRDKRSVVVSVTPAARAALEATTTPLVAALDAAAAALSARDRATIGAWLARIVRVTELELEEAVSREQEAEASGVPQVPNSWF